jgi:hypothetical protein
MIVKLCYDGPTLRQNATTSHRFPKIAGFRNGERPAEPPGGRGATQLREDEMNAMPAESLQVPNPPRGIAISGIVFSALYIACLVLLRLAVPADAAEVGAWLADRDFRNWVHIALNLFPFAGIAFLWFMGVLRNRIGLREDRFFATVFLGSGFLFVAMLFTAATVSQGLLDTFGTGVSLPGQSETYRVGRAMAYALVNTFGMRMAAVFMFITSTIGLRTAVFSRWVSFVGFVSGLVLLVLITSFAWIALVFPLWVLLVSTYILCSDFQLSRRGAARGELSSMDEVGRLD